MKNKKIIIICFGFQKKKIRSQPWHMAYGLGKGLVELGNDVVLITDCVDVPLAVFDVVSVSRLYVGNMYTNEVDDILQSIKPDMVYAFVGSHELTKPARFNWEWETNLVICNARFKITEILRLQILNIVKEFELLKLPILSSLIPGFMLRRGFKKTRAKDIVYITRESQIRYHQLGLPFGKVLQPRVDSAYIKNRDNDVSVNNDVCYYGPALTLRGIDIVLDVFNKACDDGFTGRLKLFIRDDDYRIAKCKLNTVVQRIEKSKWNASIDLCTQYLNPKELYEEIRSVANIFLPFVVTVSDAPLVVLEAALTGKKVLVLNTPGVTELVMPFDSFVASNPDQFVSELLSSSQNTIEFSSNTIDWSDWRHSVTDMLYGLEK